jgi:hypothetical protein
VVHPADMACYGICACKFFSKETLRPVTLQGAVEGTINDAYGNERVPASFGTKISRRDWGPELEHGARGRGDVVGDDIRLELGDPALQGDGSDDGLTTCITG